MHPLLFTPSLLISLLIRPPKITTTSSIYTPIRYHWVRAFLLHNQYNEVINMGWVQAWTFKIHAPGDPYIFVKISIWLWFKYPPWLCPKDTERHVPLVPKVKLGHSNYVCHWFLIYSWSYSHGLGSTILPSAIHLVHLTVSFVDGVEGVFSTKNDLLYKCHALTGGVPSRSSPCPSTLELKGRLKEKVLSSLTPSPSQYSNVLCWGVVEIALRTAYTYT